MATEVIRPARRAGLAALKDAPAVTALVDAAAIHPQAPPGTPDFPFIKWGAPTSIPIRVPACVDGAEVTVAVHGFSKGRWTGEALVESAEDHAARIGAAIAGALDGLVLDVEGGGRAKFKWTGEQLLVDQDEADAFHSVQNFTIRVLA